MRFLPLTLALMLAGVQWPLWFGAGGWMEVWRLDREFGAQMETNRLALRRNDTLEAEVNDLNHGQVAVEERARYELGMIGADEIFVQINLPADQSTISHTLHARR